MAPKLVRLGPIDKHVGYRVRLRRRLLGLSQRDLAVKLGITWQQLQKNEVGINRIASSRLFELSVALEVPIQYFFDELSFESVKNELWKKNGTRNNVKITIKTLTKQETINLVRAYVDISNAAVRRRFREIVRALGERD